MKSELLVHFKDIWLVCLGLLIFFSIFTGALFWVFRPKSAARYRYMETIPFQGE